MKHFILLATWIYLCSNLAVQASLFVIEDSSAEYKVFAAEKNKYESRLSKNDVEQLKDFAINRGDRAALASLIVRDYWPRDESEQDRVIQFKGFLSDCLNERNEAAFSETGLDLIMKTDKIKGTGFHERHIYDAQCNLAGKLILDHVLDIRGPRTDLLYARALGKFVFADLGADYECELTQAVEFYKIWLKKEILTESILRWQWRFFFMIRKSYAIHNQHNNLADDLFLLVEHSILKSQRSLGTCGCIFRWWYRFSSGD
jgi:hypothetical protein